VAVRYDSHFQEVVEVNVVLPTTAGTYRATIVDALAAARRSLRYAKLILPGLAVTAPPPSPP
jgi:hypothetical protein